jgi:hypothetical protein
LRPCLCRPEGAFRSEGVSVLAAQDTPPGGAP